MVIFSPWKKHTKS